MIYVAGVDPGVTSGWALACHLRPKLRIVDHGQLGKRFRPHGRDIRGVLEGCLDRARSTGGTLQLACEGQFIPDKAGKGQEKRAQAVDILKTAIVAGQWIGIAQSLGIEVFESKGEPTIQFDVWRKAVWGHARWRTEQAKRHAVEMLAYTYGVRLPIGQHHTAEAAWIAAYAATELDHRARIG